MSVLDDLGMTAADLREALRDGPPPERSPLLAHVPSVEEVGLAMAERDELCERLDAACDGSPEFEAFALAMMEAAQRRVCEAVDRHLAPEPPADVQRAERRVRIAQGAAPSDSPLVRMAVRELDRARRAGTRTATGARRRRHSTAELKEALGL